MLQDPDGSYIARWVPELARLPKKWVHSPWAAPAEVLEAAGVVLGDTYPLRLTTRDLKVRAPPSAAMLLPRRPQIVSLSVCWFNK